MHLTLEDVTPFDLSRALAGSYCSTMLADYSFAITACYDVSGSGATY